MRKDLDIEVEHQMIAKCEVQLKNKEGSKDLMVMLGLSETIDRLAMASSVLWYGHVLRREDSHVLRRGVRV